MSPLVFRVRSQVSFLSFPAPPPHAVGCKPALAGPAENPGGQEPVSPTLFLHRASHTRAAQGTFVTEGRRASDPVDATQESSPSQKRFMVTSGTPAFLGLNL